MAKCDVDVVLEHGGPFRGGDEVRGLIGVTVDRDVRCDALRVSLGWRTRGKGNTDRGQAVAQTLAAGDWRAGERHVHPFALQLPNGPVSYTGKLVQVEWHLEGRVDVPWAFDPKSEQVIPVSGYDPDLPYDHGPAHLPGPTPQATANVTRTTLPIVGATFVLAPLLIAGGGLLVTTSPASQHGAAAWVGGSMYLCFTLLFVALGAGLLYQTLRNAVAERRLGPVTVDLDPIAHPGSSIPVAISFTPRSRVALNGVRLALVGSERAVHGSGKHRQTHSDVFHEVAEELCGSRECLPGEPVRLSGSLRLPHDAPPSFATTDNGVRWVARVALDIDAWPDWVREHTLAVRPPAGEARGSASQRDAGDDHRRGDARGRPPG